jgi:hypothetical protein
MYQKKGNLPPIPTTLALRRNPLEEFPGSLPELSDSDIVLITHHDFDHFDRTAAGALPKRVAVVTPENGIKRLKKKGFQNIVAMRARQRVEIRGLTILATPVKHAEHLGGLLYKPGLFVRLNTGIGLTSKATDLAPEFGVLFSIPLYLRPSPAYCGFDCGRSLDS